MIFTLNKNRFLCLIFLLFMGKIFAQNMDSTQYFAFKKAKELYYSSISENSLRFVGKEETTLDGHTKGHPYYLKQDWTDGAVIYNDILYENIKIKFNITSQKLVIQHFGGYLRIELVSEKITSFTIAGQVFVYFKDDLLKNNEISTGFYRQLWQNKWTLLAKYNKTLNEEMIDSQIIKEYSESKDFFVYKKNEVIKVKSSVTLEKLFESKDVKKYAQKSELDFKKQPEIAYTELLKYCDVE